LFYVVNADYMIKLVFFGICIMKYPQKQVAQQTDRQGLRHTAHA